MWMELHTAGLKHTSGGLACNTKQAGNPPGTKALAALPNWPIFSSYSTEAVPPTCSAEVVRIKLVAYKLAGLARQYDSK